MGKSPDKEKESPAATKKRRKNGVNTNDQTVQEILSMVMKKTKDETSSPSKKAKKTEAPELITPTKKKSKKNKEVPLGNCCCIYYV